MSAAIIIPAHNEEAVIGRLLGALRELAAKEGAKVIVVCNGCTDRTAEVARSILGVQVIETEVASKSNALNLGDRAATGFPRFYIDADIQVGSDAIARVAAVLESGDTLAAAPEMRIDTAGRPWTVLAFFQVWQQLPYTNDAMVGSGFYALSEAGRARFKEFPPITSDDGYVRLLFAAHERKTVKGCHFTIRAPMTLAGLIKIKTRAHFGNIELKARFPELCRNENADPKGALLRLAVNPLWWPAIGVYVLVRLVARSRARQRWLHGDHKKWERDETSRRVAAKA